MTYVERLAKRWCPLCSRYGPGPIRRSYREALREALTDAAKVVWKHTANLEQESFTRGYIEDIARAIERLRDE